ncbi:MAG: DEAD/DEAH box helicase [Desulfobacteraceae bacterium]|nr:DEAD/DEAH box helicase [Desulfobacteraceae bacterium]
MYRRYPVRHKKQLKFIRRSKSLKIKPGADTELKKVFASIGVPDKTKFKPDKFQIEAVSAINKSDCLVTAPTGAGKTWIAEQAISLILERRGRCWYASPLKALTNSKYNEFSKIFGDRNVGILTGDRKENPDAPIIVGTTEILRNQLYDAMHSGETLSTDLVVLDEAHFLGDEERGVVWEEIMIYLPSRIPLLLLSATIGNAKQIAKWLSLIRSKECIVIEENKRPVPLFPLFFHPSGTLFPLISQSSKSKKNSPSLATPTKLPPFGDILKVLKKYRLLPAIFFLKSRADCDNALDLCMKNILSDQRRKAAINQQINELAKQSHHIAGHRQLWHLENLSVGAHHSGQLPVWKLVIETLMNEGLLDAVFATSTVAAGVNFPARTVVFLNSDRFNGTEFVPLSSTEFHQMTGRAGRRGMDNIGFAMVLPGKFMDIRLIAKLISSPPSDIVSQIRINFSMVLNLLFSYSPDQIEDLLKKSFATYLITTGKKSAGKFIANSYNYLSKDFIGHLNFLKETGYVKINGELTEDGKWASKLRVDQPLLIAEGFRLGVFPESNPAFLAAIIASFVDERETEGRIDKEFMPKSLLSVFLKVKKALKPFSRLMVTKGFETKTLFLSPAVTIHAWATGQPWEKIVSASEIAEGNLAMLILRTADNLRHIRALKPFFPKASETAKKSIELIVKEPVSSDYNVDQ